MENKNRNNNFELVQIVISVSLIVVLVMGASALMYYLYDNEAGRAEKTTPVQEEEAQQITCRVVSVDTTQHTESDHDVGTGVTVAGGKPVVVTGIVPAGEKTVTDYYVTLEDANGTVMQFTVQGDVYTALGKKIGDEIPLSFHPQEKGIIFTEQAYYTWQGKKLTNPIVINEGNEGSEKGK